MRTTVTLLLLLTLFAAVPAYARTLRTSDEPHERAAAHWQNGSTRYAAGEYAAALAEFQAGYALHPSPPFLVNIAQCLRKLDRLDEAALAYRRFLDGRTGSPRTRLDVWVALEDVTAELNHRVDALAENAALFRAFLASGKGEPALRAHVQATLDEIMRTLVHIDDRLVAGYGVASALALPRAAPRRVVATSDAGPTADHVRQRLAALAATPSGGTPTGAAPTVTPGSGNRRRSPRTVSRGRHPHR